MDAMDVLTVKSSVKMSCSDYLAFKETTRLYSKFAGTQLRWLRLSSLQRNHLIVQQICLPLNFFVRACTAAFSAHSNLQFEDDIFKKIRYYGNQYVDSLLNSDSTIDCIVLSAIKWQVQVNLCQKLFFLQNMGRTCHVQKNVLNVRNNFCTQHVLPRFELGIFM